MPRAGRPDAGRLAKELLLPLLRVPAARTTCARTTASSRTATSSSISTNRTSTTGNYSTGKQDPHELSSVYGQPGYAAAQKELEKELSRLRKDLKVPEQDPPTASGRHVAEAAK